MTCKHVYLAPPDRQTWETTRDIQVDGYQIPADEEVHLSIISTHRDERFYDDPLSFRPDRWTEEFEEEHGLSRWSG